MSDYADFLSSKQRTFAGDGIDVPADALNSALFPFQRDLVRWALRKGRAAIFAGTGLGKTAMQLEWARHIPGPVLVLAPLVVAQQTITEAAKFGIEAEYRRVESEPLPQITVTNYEMLAHFDPSRYFGVVLDEASILKNYAGETKKQLVEAFADTPYRLCCTATPAPNDSAEFANQAEFLGILTRREMLATFYTHDDEGWRLKGHAREAFYRWLASWGMSLNSPADLGYDDTSYRLPPLTILPQIVPTAYVPDGQMFATGLHGVSDRAAVRKGTLEQRVAAAVALVAKEPERQWIAWCGLNPESTALAKAIPDSIEITGSMAPDEKTERLLTFLRGDTRVLVTKPRIAGFGVNIQCATRQVFVGMGDSFEQYYQCIRRSWRFGQMQPVRVHLVLSDLEEPIYHNVMRKEREAMDAQAELVRNAAEYERREISDGRERVEYAPEVEMQIPAWLATPVEATCASA